MRTLLHLFNMMITKQALKNVFTILILAILIYFESGFIDRAYVFSKSLDSVIHNLLGFALLRVISSYFTAFEYFQRHTNVTKVLIFVFLMSFVFVVLSASIFLVETVVLITLIDFLFYMLVLFKLLQEEVNLSELTIFVFSVSLIVLCFGLTVWLGNVDGTGEKSDMNHFVMGIWNRRYYQ